MPRTRILKGRTIKEWSGGELSFKKPNIELQKYVSARINQGMITAIDSADIPPESLQLAKNAKVIFDKTSRRDGILTFGPNAPDAETVLRMASIKHPDGSGHTYRFTPTSIYDLQSGAWNEITQLTPLVGTVSDRLNIANVFDIIAFTNNGANNVQWIDSQNETSDDLIDGGYEYGSSDFRFLTSFFNRFVLAALREENEILLAWTGEFGSKNTTKHGLEDLSPLVNETAGSSPLVDSPSDSSDFITGVFGMTAVMTILREKSVWIATKQASATNPFNAYAAVPNIGCDSSFSAKVTAYGLAWLDRRSRTVYAYTPGSQPEPIGRPIEKSIINNITDPSLVFGTYDPVEDVYSVCIPAVGSSIVQIWSYYFRAKAWTYNEIEDLSSYDDAELLTAAIAIDDLLGTMDGLVGTFDDLSPVQAGESKRIFGFTDGALGTPDPDVDDDLSVDFDTDLISKCFVIPELDTYIAKIVVEYNMRIPGSLELWYAPDGGVDPNTSFILGDTFTPTVFNKPQIITFTRVVHTRRYAFAIRASNGQFDILGYEVWVYPSGQSSMIRQVS